MGLQQGDNVGVILRNVPEYITIICGLVKAGMVHVPINWRFTPAEIEYVIKPSQHPIKFFC